MPSPAFPASSSAAPLTRGPEGPFPGFGFGHPALLCPRSRKSAFKFMRKMGKINPET